MGIDRLIERLDEILQHERENGKTNVAMAAQSGMSQSYINGLLNHRSKLENVAFGKVLKLFPDIQRVLERHLEDENNFASIIASTSSWENTSHGENTLFKNKIENIADLDAYRGRLYSAILGLGLDPQTQDKVMQAVKSTT